METGIKVLSLTVSCKKCNYTCPVSIPHISRLFSLLFYIIPKPVKQALDNDDADFVTKENQRVNRSFFESSYLRYECYTCISSLIIAIHELPVTVRRLHITIRDIEIAPAKRFKGLDLYTVFDYQTKAFKSVFPGQIFEFERGVKRFVDHKQNIANQIGPIRNFSKGFSNYLGIFKMPMGIWGFLQSPWGFGYLGDLGIPKSPNI